MKIRNIIFCSGVLFVAEPVAATEAAAIARVGLDSNPHGFSDGLSPSDEEFGLVGFYSESDIGDLFYWDVDVEKAFYFDDERADKFHADVQLKLASDFDIAEVPFGYEVGFDYSVHDETYVNKENGFVTTFNAISIADRFDRDESGYFVGLAYLIRDDADIFVRYGSKALSYETFEIPDLDNLDNTEVSTTLGARLAPRDSGEFYVELTHHEREYDDRRDRDLDGVLVPDTDLILNRYETEIGYVHKPDDRSQWEYAFTYENRTSNGSHFYESQRGVLNIRGDHWLADYHLLSFEFDFQTFFYDESLDQSFVYFDPGDVDERGVTLQVEYTWVLATLFQTNLAFYTNLQVAAYESPNPFYVYQRNQASAGIRWAID